MMKVEYTVKSHYGNDYKYPMNPVAQMITELTGRKTLSESDISTLRKHGFDCVQVFSKEG